MFLEYILLEGSTFISVESFRKKNALKEKSIFYSFIETLKLFNVINVLEEDSDSLIIIKSDLAFGFIKSLIEYLRNDLSLISRWDINSSEKSDTDFFTWGDSFLSSMEKRRFHTLGCSKTLDEKDIALFIIKARVIGCESPMFLMQYNNVTSKYQFIGGYLKFSEESLNENLQRLVSRELKLNDFRLGDNFIINPFFEKVFNKTIARKSGLLTLHKIQCYEVNLPKEDLKLQPGDIWLSIEELEKGLSEDGLAIQTPFENLSDIEKKRFIEMLLNMNFSLNTTQKLNNKNNKIKSIDNSISDAIFLPDSESTQHLIAIRYNSQIKKVDKGFEENTIRTINAFLNRNGGELLVGIDQNKNIIGVSNDIETLKEKNEEAYMQFLTNLIVNNLGNDVMSFIDIRFESYLGKRILIIVVKKSIKPVFVKRGDKREFYIRTGKTNKLLNDEEVYKYIQINW